MTASAQVADAAVSVLSRLRGRRQGVAPAVSPTAQRLLSELADGDGDVQRVLRSDRAARDLMAVPLTWNDPVLERIAARADQAPSIAVLAALAGSTAGHNGPDPVWQGRKSVERLMREAERAAARRWAYRERDRIVDRSLPTISVLMASRRPALASRQLLQLTNQTHARFEVIVGLHRVAGGQDVLQAASRSGLRVTTFESDAATLGEVLNQCVERASGEFVTKVDDDDSYAAWHLEEVCRALVLSSADIAGRAAEFVTFENCGWGLRRYEGGGDSSSPVLAGGTLTLRRSTLSELGGFDELSLGEDRALIDRVVRAGGQPFRCNAFGFVLRRHGDSTWRGSTHRLFLTADRVLDRELVERIALESPPGSQFSLE